MYYDSIQNDIGAERAFLEANRLNVATSSSSELIAPVDGPAEVEDSVSETIADEPAGEGAPGTAVSEDQKLPEVHGMFEGLFVLLFVCYCSFFCFIMFCIFPLLYLSNRAFNREISSIA